MFSSQEIGSSLVLEMIFEAQQSDIKSQVWYTKFKIPKNPGIQRKYSKENLQFLERVIWTTLPLTCTQIHDFCFNTPFVICTSR